MCTKGIRGGVSIDTLNLPSIDISINVNISIDTWLTLDQHLIGSWSIVDWVLTKWYVSIDTSWHVCKN